MWQVMHSDPLGMNHVKDKRWWKKNGKKEYRKFSLYTGTMDLDMRVELRCEGTDGEVVTEEFFLSGSITARLSHREPRITEQTPAAQEP